MVYSLLRRNQHSHSILPLTESRTELAQENALALVENARRIALPAEFRLREELDLLSRQWVSIFGSLFVLLYLVLIVFMNLAFYRYEAPADGMRLKDLGYELLPEMPAKWYPLRDLPLVGLVAFAAVILMGTLRVCFPCRRGARHTDCKENEDENVPYIVNIAQRFTLVYAVGQALRGLTYLVTTIPGGNSKCLSELEVAQHKPTFMEVFYRPSSVTSNCGDLVFSGHLLLCSLIICCANRYAAKAMGWTPTEKRIYMGLAIGLVILEVISIISARNHYTVDCVISLYLTPALWYYFENSNPIDLEPDRVKIAKSILATYTIKPVDANETKEFSC